MESSDLIRTQKISDIQNNKNQDLLTFEPKFLYNIIVEGYFVVLDNINEASSRVIVRLNGLLDKKIMKNKKFSKSLKIQKTIN